MASFVPSLSFWGEQRGVESIGMVLAPEDFYIRVLEDPYMQLGALVFNASKARDYYNGILADFNALQQRAYAYEAEYLNTAKQLDREFRQMITRCRYLMLIQKV